MKIAIIINYKGTYLLKSEISGTQISSGRNCTRWKPPKLFLFHLRNSFVQVWKKHTNFKLQPRRYIRILRCQLLAAICKTVKDNSRTLYPNQGIRSAPTGVFFAWACATAEQAMCMEAHHMVCLHQNGASQSYHSDYFARWSWRMCSWFNKMCSLQKKL